MTFEIIHLYGPYGVAALALWLMYKIGMRHNRDLVNIICAKLDELLRETRETRLTLMYVLRNGPGDAARSLYEPPGREAAREAGGEDGLNR